MRRELRAVFDFNQYERDRWVEAQASKVPRSSRVLDVGAGSCPYRSFFAHCDYRTHDFGQLEPTQLWGQSGYGVIDYLSDILSIPVPDGSFDVILCTEVLEHVAEPIRAVHEFARVLRPGGSLILTAPLGSGLHQQPHHFYGGYTPHWYRKVLPEAGFEKVTIDANGGFFKHYGQESQRFASLLAPRVRRRLLWAPVWLLTLPWFAFICPIWAHVLDKLDTEKAFTVGYFVTAIRCP